MSILDWLTKLFIKESAFRDSRRGYRTREKKNNQRTKQTNKPTATVKAQAKARNRHLNQFLNILTLEQKIFIAKKKNRTHTHARIQTVEIQIKCFQQKIQCEHHSGQYFNIVRLWACGRWWKCGKNEKWWIILRYRIGELVARGLLN